jgi:hypothetical protein
MRDAGKSRFAILCLGRSGSSHLVSLLDSHPDARCFGELFNRTGRGISEFADAPETDPGAFLDRLASGCSKPVLGFKLPFNSILDEPSIIDMLRSEPDYRIIRLSRRNLLAQLVSRRLQSSTRVSHSIYGNYGDARVSLDPRKAMRTIAGMEEHERELDSYAAGHPTLEVAYEDLDNHAVLAELQEFLGLEPRPLRSWFEKLRTMPLQQTVENWAEVEAALTGTRFEPMLRIES